ncbi:hypothetical protein CC78DRAFT_608880 [Lojkania enalia]|uniref:Uncharacterized protein n=1 Tax=Lojkania enalia TaxID=147567 RepID=A0A9P4K2P2_9PLEO|nr:hypothetical protein CC78DRAFT_608880 [Didymosphaeria enalia]
MHLLQHGQAGDFSLTNDLIGDDRVPLFAILSHTWSEGGESKSGYNKIRELQVALNSLSRWYRNAAKYYVYLSDISTAKRESSYGFSNSVKFFSRERKLLGSKRLVMQKIYKITGIPRSALQGAPLFQFSTKLEDEAYSLLGSFDECAALIHGEGIARALQRLINEVDKREKCIQDLRLTDPRYDKKRIEDTKSGFIDDSYRWILDNANFLR